jgi:hypothetical protein
MHTMHNAGGIINTLYMVYYDTGIAVFGSELMLQWVFIAAVVAHFGEALYAFSICRSLKLLPKDTMCWCIQTFILGYPSLKLLLREERIRSDIGSKRSA